jgi:hypothetical protein
VSWRNLPAAEEARRRELHRQGLSDLEIGLAVNRTRAAIACWRLKNGLKANRGPRQQRTVLPNTESIIYGRPRANRLFIQAFERDLLRMADKSREAFDVDLFLKAWRGRRASEVIEMIQEGVLT